MVFRSNLRDVKILRLEGLGILEKERISLNISLLFLPLATLYIYA